jgi:hypothetical protein
MRAPVLIAFLVAACAAQQPASEDAPAPPPEIAAPETSPLTEDERDRNIVSGCADAHVENRGAACIGAVTRRCAETMGDGAETTGGAALCAMREQRAWAWLIDLLVSDLRQRETATQAALLDAALNEGEAWTNARCAYEASIYEGGSLARLVAAQCRRDVTAERAISLYRRTIDYDQ